MAESTKSVLPKSILLIEDEKDIVAMYKMKFIEYGFKFYSTDNNAEGMKLALDHKPSAILLDIKLGDDNGIDLLKQLKEDTSTRDIPVMLFSNAYQKEYEKLGHELGAVEFILKTKVLPDETIAIVEKYIK